MKKIEKMRFVIDAVDVIYKMCDNGWDERNGGNFSYLLSDEESRVFKNKKPFKTLDLDFDASYIKNRFILVTATGQYFRNVKKYTDEVLGIVKIMEDGKHIGLYWGFKNDGRPTSEFPSHILCHIERLKQDVNQRVIIHTHATYSVALTFLLPEDEKIISNSLWKMSTECAIVFPEGVGYLPWELCGTVNIGKHTAEKMKKYRIVLWSMHGVYVAGNSINEAFGLVETVEKAATIYCITQNNRVREISKDNILELCEAFKVNVNKDLLQ